MDIDNYIINDGEKDIAIFPLLEVNKNDKNYLIYSKTQDTNKILDNIFVGEITNNNTILPVDSNMLEDFEKIINDSMDTIRKKIYGNSDL